MGYTKDDRMVRVEFFKGSGKWYTTEAVKWREYKGVCISQAFANALRAHFEATGNENRLYEMTAVCLDPYHEHAHPIMLRGWMAPRWNDVEVGA